MNGLLKPTSGTVIVDGLDTKKHTTAQISRKVGYVFQNPDDQIFHSDVYSEIKFGPKNLGLTEEEIENNALEAAELTGITDHLRENPYNLPFSTRKFVTIASVIAMDSDVFILDEPTAGQDLYGMNRLNQIIESLVKNNKTVITITHDMEFVVNNFERVIVMANRKKIADQDKREIFWDFKTLEESMLKQPYISHLSYHLGLKKDILNIKEMLNCLDKVKKKIS